MRWAAARLGQIAILGPQYGANARAVPRSGDRPRYVRITDIRSDGTLNPNNAVEAEVYDPSDFVLKDGDLLFARSGNTVGKTYRYSAADGRCLFAGYLIRFRLNPSLIDSRYAFYFTQSGEYQNWVASKRRVAGQPNINGAEYSALIIPLPPLSEQRRIVELLDQADALRQKRATADATAECILPALFREMFGDPATNPKRWPTQALGQIATTLSGATPSTENEAFWGGEVPWVSAKDMKALEILDSVDHVSEIAFQETNLRLIPVDSVLIVVRGMILAHTVPIALGRVPLAINQDLKAFCELGELPAEYIQWVLLSQHNSLLKLVTTAAHGTRKLDTDALLSLPIPMPPKGSRHLWAERVRNHYAASRHRGEVHKKLHSLFATLLHHAFTGALTSRWRAGRMAELLAEMEHQARALGLPTAEVNA